MGDSPDPQPVGTLGADAQQAGAQHANTQHANTEHVSTQHANTEHVSTQHANTEHVSTQHANTEHVSTQQVSAEQAGIWQAGAQQASQQQADVADTAAVDAGVANVAAANAGSRGSRSDLPPRWVGVAVLVLAAAVLFTVYLRLSRTLPEDSDEANVLLSAWDMFHGNFLLHGWYLTDVSFYTTELPQYAMLGVLFGLHADTGHIAAAMTYTLIVVLAVILARGGIWGSRPAARTLIAGGMVIAPQLGIGVFVLVLTIGHIGTGVPVMAILIGLDRAPRRWYVPVVATFAFAWVLIADELALIILAAPIGLVCGIRVIAGMVKLRSLTGGIKARWYELALAGAALVGEGIALTAERVTKALGGFVMNPVPFSFNALHGALRTNLNSLWSVPQIYGADYRGLTGADHAFALLHMVSIALVVIALVLVAWRSFSWATMVDQVIAVAIIANLALYIGTSAAAEGAHEIAVIAPLGAALAARMLAPSRRHATVPERSQATASGSRNATIPEGSQAAVPESSRATGPGSRQAATAGSAPEAARVGAWTRRLRIAGACAGIAVLGGYLAGLGRETTQPSQPAAFAPLAAWLEAHHLHYGLGGYWESSIITVQTGGKVEVRALLKASAGRDLWLAKTSWYDPATQYANFIVMSSTPGFMNNWEPRAVIDQVFGTPAHSYTFGPYTIMVWNRNLLPSIPLKPA